MKFHSSSLLVSDSIGTVSLLTCTPTELRAVIILAHGAGAGMTHRFMESLALELAELSIGTVRYNFPYIEKKSKRPDVPAIAEKTVGAVLSHAINSFPSVPAFLGGKSFGGRMSSQYFSKNHTENVKGIVFYGFPLHAPGDPGTARAEHLKSINIPLLFLQGSRDALAKFSLVEKVCAGLPAATLVKLEGADHSFKVKKTELINELALHTLKWMQKLA